MKTVDYRGRGLIRGASSPTALGQIAQEVTRSCRSSIFIAYLDRENELIGCSVLLKLDVEEAAEGARHIKLSATELDAAEIVILLRQAQE